MNESIVKRFQSSMPMKNSSVFQRLRFAKAGFSVLGFMILGKTISLIWKILLSHLGTDALGLTELALTTVTFLSSFGLLGMNTSLIRFVSRERNSETTHQSKGQAFFFVGAILSVVCSIAFTTLYFYVPALSNLLHGEKGDFPLYFLLIVPAVICLYELSIAYSNALKNIATYSFHKYVSPPILRLFFLISLVFFYKKITTGQIVMLHIFLSTLSYSLLSLIKTKIHLPGVYSYLKKNVEQTKQFLKYSGWVSGSFILFVVYDSIDVFTLAKYSTLNIVGVLSIASLVVDGLDIIFLPFLNTLQTQLGDYEKVTQRLFFLGKNILWLMGISSVLSLGILMFQGILIPFAFGSGYAISGMAMLFLIAGKIVQSSLVFPLRTFLDYEGRVKITLCLMCISVVIKFFLLNFFVPIMQIEGLALSELIVASIHAGLCLIVIFLFHSHSLNLKKLINK